jgi:hypothetical protein
MFDLSLAHIARAERERDLVADLRDRQVLKAPTADTAVAPARALIERPVARPRAARTRAIGRQG